MTMLNAWTEQAFSATTTINGGFIKTHTIQTEHLATDAIMSSNFQASSNASSPFSATGTFLDLTTGNLYSPNFGIDNTYGTAYLNGEIIATSGRIGNSSANNYWEIGTKTDYNANQSAALIGKGTAYIQIGDFQLSNSLFDTRSYNSSNQITYPVYNNTYWDFGIQSPTLNPSTTGFITGVDDNFIYIRNHASTIPSLKTDWNYIFRIDKSGMIYMNGTSLDDRYALKTDVGSTYLPTTGGTVSGDLTVTGTLTATASSANQLTHWISINGTQWTGSSNTTIGTLGVGYGGTGATTFTSGEALIGNGSGVIQTRTIKNNTSVGALGYTSDSAGTALTTINTITYWDGRYQASGNKSNLEYVKYGKLGTIVTHDYSEFITSSGGTIDGSLSVTDLTAGNLVVNGAGRFTNGLYGDLTGNAATATKFNASRAIALTGDTTGSASWDGSSGLSIATKTDRLTTVGDNRTTATIPNDYANKIIFQGLKTNSSFGSPSTDGYSYVIGLRGWNDNTGGKSHELAFNNSGIFRRVGATTSWESWVKLIDSGNYTSYTVTKTGSGASGTWAIDISGNAATATTATQVGNSLKIQLNGGTTEGTNQFTFNGSAAKSFSITKSSIGLGSVTNNAQVKGLSSGTTSGHFVLWGSDGYTVSDSGLGKANLISNVTVSDDKITIYKADGSTPTEYTLNITGQIVTKATVLSNASGTAISLGSASAPVYFSNGVPAQANTIPAVTLNGSATNSPNFFAPTAAGTNNYVLKSNGSGAPTWVAQSTLSVGSATSATSATSAGSLTNKTLDSTTINNTAGSFAFSGSGEPWAGTDWVGLQIGDSVDKFQIHAKNGTTLEYRQNDSGGTNTSWGSWYDLLSSGNYTSYTVTKTGSGASGTWAIDISGNAATATKATQDGSGNTITSTYLKKAGDTMTGNLLGNSTATLGSTAAPFHQLVLGGTTTATMTADSTNPRITFCENTGTQPVHLVYTDYDNYRSPAGLKIVGGTSATPAWLEVEGTVYAAAFNGNATSATKATQDGSGNVITSTYAPIASPTFTGFTTSPYYIGTAKMSISSGKMSEIATAPRGGLFADGVAFSNPATRNDQGWIRVLGTGESDTVLEIATGDDGAGAGEQIVARKYNTSSAAVYEMKLLDTAGNTTIPGTFKIANGVTLQYSTTTKSLDFVFA